MKKDYSYGNFRQQRQWSSQAKQLAGITTCQTYNLKNINKTAKGWLVNYYGLQEKDRAERLLDNLINDLWLNILPPAAKESLKANRAELDEIISELLYDYGNVGIIYTLKKSSGLKIAQDVYLVPRRGMPIKEFLLWYKGSKPDLRTLEEWSGIPKTEISFVYRCLIKFFRNKLEYLSTKAPSSTKKTKLKGEILVM